MAMSEDEEKFCKIQGLIKFVKTCENGNDLWTKEQVMNRFYNQVKEIVEGE